MKMPNDRLTKEMFNTDYMLENNNWRKCVWDIFITFGEVDLYAKKCECDFSGFTYCEQKWL